MPITLAQVPEISVGDTEAGAIDYTDLLDSGEAGASVTITELTSTDLTLTNKAVSSGSLTILGNTVSTGKAVQWVVSGQSATGGPNSDGLYTLVVTLTTNASPARVIKRHAQFRAV